MTTEVLQPDQQSAVNEVQFQGQEVLAIAEAVQNQVRDVLTYDPQAKLEDMAEGRANCLGHTILGAELLSDQGVDHLVGFVNGHATTIVPVVNEEGQTELHLRDMLSRSLNQDITRAVDTGVRYDLEHDEAASSGRILGSLNAQRIAYRQGANLQQLVAKHPWMSANNSLENPKTRLILSLFEPQRGREVLGSYAWFQEAVAGGDLSGATEAMIDMTGVYPDIDIRGETPKQVRGVVKRVAMAGDPDKARAVTEAFYSSFGKSSDTRVAEYKADCLRTIAKIVKDSSNFSGDLHNRFAREAMTLYGLVMRRPEAYKGSVMSKLAICQSMLSET